MTDEQLQRFRSSIDNIDAALILLLAERFKVTEDVGEYKAQHGLPPADPGRETRADRAASTARDPRPTSIQLSVEAFLRLVIDEVIRHHERTANQPWIPGDAGLRRASDRLVGGPGD